MGLDPETLEGLKEWAQQYKGILELLKKDFELKLKYKKYIYIAIDFYDIIAHVYPLDNFFQAKDKETELKKEIARIGLFNTLCPIYVSPLVLLPPYISECNDFFSVSKNKLFNIIDDKNKKSISQNIKSSLENIKDQKISLNQLDHSILYIALLYSPYFMKGLDGLKELMKSSISPVPVGLDDYLTVANNIKEMENKKYFHLLTMLRPKKTLSNIRDAKALQYVEEINKIKSNEILLFTTSSPVFLSYSEGLFKQFGSCKYPLFRNIEFFYYVVIYMYMSLGLYDKKINIKNDKFDLDVDQLTQMCDYLRDHINMFNYILSLSTSYIDAVNNGTLCGKYSSEGMELSLSRAVKLKKITELIEESLSIAYLKNISGGETLDHLQSFINKKYIDDLYVFRDLFNEERFSLLLTDRISKLRNEQIDFESNMDLALDSKINELCPDLKSEYIFCFNQSEFNKILKNNFDNFNNKLGTRDAEILKSPVMRNLPNKEWLIYDNDHINKYIYLVRLPTEEAYCFYKINIEILYNELIEFLLSYKKGDISLERLKSRPVISLLRKVSSLGKNIPIANINDIDNIINKIDKIL